MTEDATMTVTSTKIADQTPTPSTKRDGLWRRAWRACAIYFNGTTKRKTVALGVVLIAVGFQLVIKQLDGINDHNRRSDNFANAQAIYQTEVVTYTTAYSQWAVCLSTATRSDANRGQWQVAVDKLNASGLHDAALALQAGPLLSSAPFDASTCIKPASLPPPPEP